MFISLLQILHGIHKYSIQFNLYPILRNVMILQSIPELVRCRKIPPSHPDFLGIYGIMLFSGMRAQRPGSIVACLLLV